MAGYTRPPFRALCRQFACGLVFTEMITAEGTRRRSPRTLFYLTSMPEERPIAAQLYGTDPAAFAEAAAVIESLNRFDAIDINCGCPAPKVTRKGAGVVLMRDPERIGAIVAATRRATSLPVTVKTRLGLSPQEENVLQVARAAEACGAQAFFLHARFASQGHSGPADLEALARVKQALSIPVIGNGGIVDGPSAAKMLQRTEVDGLMIARAALGNPWIFDEIHAYLTDQPYIPPSDAERRDLIEEHLRRLHHLTQMENPVRRRPHEDSERAACQRFRGHLVRYLAGRPNLRRLRRALMEMETIADVMTGVEEVLESVGK
jgi:nifR3 family TIM-barrel protein